MPLICADRRDRANRKTSNSCRYFYAAITSFWIAVYAGSTALAKTAAQIDDIVFDEMDRQKIVGMAMAIVKNGNIYYASGYGYEDLASGRPVTTRTLFRWGSISKTLTAVAALKLAEQNPAFGLNDRVTEHVGYWPAYGNKGNIRIRHLLSNRSGIIHYTQKKNCYQNRSPDYSRHRHTSKYYNAKQGVAVFGDQRLCFDPGTNYKYSTFGYSLLGSAIEGGSSTSYAAWVRDRIKEPLGMYSLRQAIGTYKGYDQKYNNLRPVLSGNKAWKLPGGGWESNILDLAKFANALLQGSLLDDTSRLWTTVPGNPSYGYGVKYTLDKRHVWHEGQLTNTRALMYLYPQSPERLGIVLMTNSVHSKPVRISRRLAKLLMD
ncbi:MAG: serine hydrolase domain-containing protein [Gammaproteobacteria bacterium]|jgi:CubicO group peptidase (beta-lactamase class C family)